MAWTPRHHPGLDAVPFSLSLDELVQRAAELFWVDFSSDGAGIRPPAGEESESPEGDDAAVTSIGHFLSGYLGLATSMCPCAISPTVTLYEAAAQPKTRRFTLWGAVIVLPIVIAYIVYSYSVFSAR